MPAFAVTGQCIDMLPQQRLCSDPCFTSAVGFRLTMRRLVTTAKRLVRFHQTNVDPKRGNQTLLYLKIQERSLSFHIDGSVGSSSCRHCW